MLWQSYNISYGNPIEVIASVDCDVATRRNHIRVCTGGGCRSQAFFFTGAVEQHAIQVSLSGIRWRCDEEYPTILSIYLFNTYHIIVTGGNDFDVASVA